MSCKISKKLTENGENDEKLFFPRFFPTKLIFYKNLLMKIVFYLMQKVYHETLKNLMSEDISEKLTENGENDENPFFHQVLRSRKRQ